LVSLSSQVNSQERRNVVSEEYVFGDLTRDADDMLRSQQGRMAQVEEMQRRMAEIVGSAVSEDERISVAFSEANGLQKLDLDPRAMRLASEDLSAEIIKLVNQAREDAQQQAQQLVTEMIGSGAPDPHRLLEQLPAFEETMAEILRDTEQMGVDITEIVERMQRQIDTQ
jgi:hypothetical protein